MESTKVCDYCWGRTIVFFALAEIIRKNDLIIRVSFFDHDINILKIFQKLFIFQLRRTIQSTAIKTLAIFQSFTPSDSKSTSSNQSINFDDKFSDGGYIFTRLCVNV